MDETVEQYEKRVAEARLTFSRREEAARMHTSQIQTFASDAMKAPALVAAGGVAAALGFTAPTTLGSQLRWAAVLLIAGSIGCLMRSGFLFLSILR